MSNIVVSSDLPHTWDHIRRIRHQVGEALKERDSGLRSAAMMVASELVENAVKYGETVPAARNISMSLALTSDQLQISVRNGCRDGSGIGELQRRIREIAAAPDKAALYMARLEQLMADPLDSGKLGLYRVAFEGQFDMQLDYADQVVTIVATRTHV